MEIDLLKYNLVVCNSSGGKDSIVAMWEINRLATEQRYRGRIIVSHQDLGQAEWEGTTDLVREQAAFFGWELFITKRRRKNGDYEELLDAVRRRGMWPSNKARYCTSDFKRSSGGRVVTAETKELIKANGKASVLHVFGFRADESPSRAKRPVLSVNKRLTTKKRLVHDFLPVHDWSTLKVWDTINENNLPYHFAYDLNMPRLSCVFCIFSPFDALVIAGYKNRELLDKYISVEDEIGHTFRHNFSLKEVREAIEKGYIPKSVNNWVM